MDAQSLIAAAATLAKPFAPSADVKSGGVAAALRTAAGNVYTGVCVDTASSLGFCAKHAAVAQMLCAGQSEVREIVAISCEGIILPPCGRCREWLWQLDQRNAARRVIFERNGESLTRRSLALPMS